MRSHISSQSDLSLAGDLLQTDHRHVVNERPQRRSAYDLQYHGRFDAKFIDQDKYSTVCTIAGHKYQKGVVFLLSFEAALDQWLPECY